VTHGQLRALHLVETTEDLTALGFGSVPLVGSTRLVAGSQAMGASVEGIDELDGLVMAPEQQLDAAPGSRHDNGVTAIDHVVVTTPDPERTTAAFEAEGLELRRVRRFETPKGTRRQSFFWLGDVICEVVSADTPVGDGPAQWWGIAFTVVDLDETVAFFGDQVTPPKDAVQPGRRVATLKAPQAKTPTLLISPHISPGTS